MTIIDILVQTHSVSLTWLTALQIGKHRLSEFKKKLKTKYQ